MTHLKDSEIDIAIAGPKPCYQCEDRYRLCHAECSRYKEYLYYLNASKRKKYEWQARQQFGLGHKWYSNGHKLGE